MIEKEIAEIQKIINQSQEFDPKNIELIKKQGVVFTKSEVCQKIIHELRPEITDTICEPSVGKGVFVFNLLEYFRNNGITNDELVYFVEKNLYCYDIDDNFINIFKYLLNDYFKIIGYDGDLILNNIKTNDFMFIENSFDIIFGNPPYVRIQNLEEEYIDKLNTLNLETIKKGNIDLYYAFIEKSLRISKKLGFIIPNSFLRNKSGKVLRNIINDRLVKVYDNKNEKIWNNISTFTCIVICDDLDRTTFIYETIKQTEAISKKDSEWFKHSTNNIIKPLIKYTIGGIATLRDKIYKFDYADDNYVYKDGEKVEKEICRKTWKATTKEYFWFIYPYDDNNVLLSEDFIKEKYPFAYEYLVKHKKELNKRDRGNIKKLSMYGNWYGYGRRQGLVKKLSDNDIQVILPLTFIKGNLHYKIDDSLILSGIAVVLDKNNLDKFLSIVNSDEFQNYLEINNKILYDKDTSKVWLTMSTTSISNY